MTTLREAFALSPSQLAELSPPGTVRILDQSDSSTRLVKFPPPSSSPLDPLNLPRWRKAAALLVTSVYAFVANYSGSVVAPALQLWPAAFPEDARRPFSQLGYMIAVQVLMLGASNVWWVPLSNWVGRRPVLLLATLLMTATSVWCAKAESFGSLLAARVLQGAGGGAADTVAPALIGELYFIHERGRAMAIYTIFLCLGSLVGGLTGGYLAFGHGWASTFWVSTALSGFVFLGVAFLVPETLFDRVLDTDGASSSNGDPEKCHNTSTKNEKASTIQLENPPSPSINLDNPSTHPSTSYLQTLRLSLPPFHNRKPLLHHLLQPWRTALLPGTLLVMLHYAGLVGGIVTVSLVGAQLVASPPYLWGPNAGLINVGALVGAVLGYVYTHVVADGRLKREAKRRKSGEGEGKGGVAEAEDRLPTLFPPLAVATAGFFVFGFCARYPGGKRWVGLEVGFGMLSFGLMQVPSVGFNYLIDAYGPLAADCFTIVTILRAVIAFAWTFFVAAWVEDRGAAEPFGIFGMLMGLFSLLTIPLWKYGKRLRIVTSKSLEACYR